MNKADRIVLILLGLKWYLFIAIVIFIGIIKAILGNGIDPIDDSIHTKREIITMAEVRDSVGNGFDVVFTSKKDVSAKRAKEMRSRENFFNEVKKLEKEAPLHFGNMLYTDIYDFAFFAKKYDYGQDIIIYHVSVAGYEKCNLYIGENPKIPNSAKKYDPDTEQGILFINDIDVYNRDNQVRRPYRYQKCKRPHSVSYEDEHFSHFSEEEKIKKRW